MKTQANLPEEAKKEVLSWSTYWNTPTKGKSVETSSNPFLEDKRISYVYFKRLLCSYFISLFFFSFLTYLFIYLINFAVLNVVNPLSIFYPLLHFLLFSTISNLFKGALTLLLIHWIIPHQIQISHPPVHPCRNKEWFRDAFFNVLYPVIIILATATLSTSLLSFFSYSSHWPNISSCSGEGGSTERSNLKCGDEGQLFIQLFSVLGSIMYLIELKKEDGLILNFPIPQLSLYETLSTAIRASAHETKEKLKKPLFLFFIIYFLFNEHIKILATNIYSGLYFFNPVKFTTSPNLTPLIYSHPYFYIVAILTIYATLALLRISYSVTKICLSRRLMFPIDFENAEEGQILMSEALISTSSYIKYLSFYDLKFLCYEQGDRLWDIFNLSHPGLNPTNWIGILVGIASVIKESLTDLEDIIENLSPNDEYSTTTTTIGGSFDEFSSPWDSLTKTSSNDIRLRNLASEHRVDSLLIKPQPIVIAKDETFIKSKWRKLKRLLSKLSIKWQYFPGLTLSLFRPYSPAALHNALADYRLLIWSTQIFTYIVKFSISNDKNGIVASRIGQIITLHIRYYEVLNSLRANKLDRWIPEGTKRYPGLINVILTEYKKSILFFYHYYSKHVNTLQMEDHIIKSWIKIADCEDDAESYSNVESVLFI